MLLHLSGLVAIKLKKKKLQIRVLIFRAPHNDYTQKEQENTGHERQYSELLQMGKSSP